VRAKEAEGRWQSEAWSRVAGVPAVLSGEAAAEIGGLGPVGAPVVRAGEVAAEIVGAGRAMASVAQAGEAAGHIAGAGPAGAQSPASVPAAGSGAGIVRAGTVAEYMPGDFAAREDSPKANPTEKWQAARPGAMEAAARIGPKASGHGLPAAEAADGPARREEDRPADDSRTCSMGSATYCIARRNPSGDRNVDSTMSWFCTPIRCIK